MSSWHWLVEGVVIAVHAEQIAEHGGSDGLRDRGILSLALASGRMSEAEFAGWLKAQSVRRI